MRTGRLKKTEIYLTAEERRMLHQLLNSSDLNPSEAKRVQAILLSAEGFSNKAIAEKLGLSRFTIGLWRNLYLYQGISGIWHQSSGRKYKMQGKITDPSINYPNYSLCNLRPHRLLSFRIHNLQLLAKKFAGLNTKEFINLPRHASEEQQFLAEPGSRMERIIRIGLLFAGQPVPLPRLKQIRSNLNRCFTLTRELDALDAHNIPYQFNDAKLTVQIHLPGQLHICFWPIGGKWVDYLDKTRHFYHEYGIGASAVIKCYQQKILSHFRLPAPKKQKSRRQKESEAKRKRVAETIRLLSDNGLNFLCKNNGYYMSIQGPEKMRIELWPGSGAWRIIGDRKRYSGNPQEFLDWYLAITKLNRTKRSRITYPRHNDLES